jgi:hypothetical protein
LRLRRHERWGGPGGELLPGELAVRLRRFDESLQLSFAFGDVKESGRGGIDLLGALEAFERLGVSARGLKLVPLLEEVAGGVLVGVGDGGDGWGARGLGVRGGGEGEEKKRQKGRSR